MSKFSMKLMTNKSKGKATIKQLKYMERNNIAHSSSISKREAIILINSHKCGLTNK